MIVAADFDPIAGIHDNRKLGTAHHQISDLCLVQFHGQAQVTTGFLREQTSGQPQKRRSATESNPCGRSQGKEVWSSGAWLLAIGQSSRFAL
jgi:hypothetical protein